MQDDGRRTLTGCISLPYHKHSFLERAYNTLQIICNYLDKSSKVSNLLELFCVLQIEITSFCMCVSISATVALFCLFGPKVYIVIFQPHKNVKQSATPGLQGGGRGSAKPFIPSTNKANALQILDSL